MYFLAKSTEFANTLRRVSYFENQVFVHNLYDALMWSHK